MIFYLIGIDHKATPLRIRQTAYQRRKEIIDFAGGLQEARVLFTCNRVEIYGQAPDFKEVHKAVRLLRRRFQSLFDNAYVRLELREVIVHALRLACGLESQLKGEEQIARQLYSWIRQEGFGRTMHRLWCQVLSSAYDIRGWSGLKQVSIAAIVLEDVFSRREPGAVARIVVVGTGKVAELFVRESDRRVRLFFAARKKHSRARQLAESAGGQALFFKEAVSLFPHVDAVVSATSSPHHLLRKEHFSEIGARGRDLYLYDLAVPQDVDPAVSGLKGISLYTLDDLDSLFTKYNQRLTPAVARAEALIREAAKRIREESDAYDYQAGDTAKSACLATG